MPSWRPHWTPWRGCDAAVTAGPRVGVSADFWKRTEYLAEDGTFSWFNPPPEDGPACEGIGEYVPDPGAMHCAGAQAANVKYVPVGRRYNLGVEGIPDYAPNRTVIPYGVQQSILPDRPERVAWKKGAIDRLCETWVFADGHILGPFSGYQMRIEDDGSRFVWRAHLDDFTNVVFLDAHSASVSYVQYYRSPAVDQWAQWCAARSWHTMWD